MSIPVPTSEEAQQTEPAIGTGLKASVATAVIAIVGVLVAFGVGVTEAQGTAILSAVVALLTAAPLVAGWFTRQKVWSPATVAALLEQERRKASGQRQA